MSQTALQKDRERYEKIGGEFFLMASASTYHAAIARNISRIFSNFLKGKICKTYFKLDTFLDDDNTFIPDVVIVCDPSKIKPNGISGAPDLVVEILSPSTAKNDLGKKFKAYEKFGVKEYWIVDPSAKRITVYVSENNQFSINGAYYYVPKEDRHNWHKDDIETFVDNINVSFYQDLIVPLEEVFED